MKSTGIVRKIDQLGRIVLPKELRNIFDIQEGTPMEVYTDEDTIVLKKHQTKCTLCGNEENLEDYIGTKICEACIEDIRTMKANPKIKTKCRTNSKIIKACLYVDSHYFSKRESISFNEGGFIGFAGWASDSNVRPIILGFNKWCDWLVGEKLKGNKPKKTVSNL